MTKTITMPSRSKKNEVQAIDAMMSRTSENNVAQLGNVEIKMSRITFELPQELHQRLKVGCAQEGMKMNALLTELIENRFPAKT